MNRLTLEDIAGKTTELWGSKAPVVEILGSGIVFKHRSGHTVESPITRKDVEGPIDMLAEKIIKPALNELRKKIAP